MERTRIGDLEVSRIGLGTWAIGGWMWGGTDEEQAIRTIHAALERGIDLLDTAPVYGFGRSEEIVGEALARLGGRADDVKVATKVGLEWDDAGRIRRNSTPERLRKEIEDSLRRLRRDHVDLYQVHWPDDATPVEETAATLEALHKEGKIRAIGVSNFSPVQMALFHHAAPLHSDQPPYNLFERGIEKDALPWCRAHDTAVVAYGALCRGLLSGKMSKDRTFEGDDLRKNDPKFQGERFAQYLAAADRLQALARERFDHDLIHLALRWLLDRRGVTVALWGARRPDQLEPVDRVFGWHVDEQADRAIDAILDETIQDPVGPEFMAPPPARPTG